MFAASFTRQHARQWWFSPGQIQAQGSANKYSIWKPWGEKAITSMSFEWLFQRDNVAWLLGMDSNCVFDSSQVERPSCHECQECQMFRILSETLYLTNSWLSNISNSLWQHVNEMTSNSSFSTVNCNSRQIKRTMADKDWQVKMTTADTDWETELPQQRCPLRHLSQTSLKSHSSFKSSAWSTFQSSAAFLQSQVRLKLGSPGGSSCACKIRSWVRIQLADLFSWD